MANSIKDRLVSDLEKAKSEGNLRTSRIREIVKEAVSQAALEVKAGMVELRGVARDAMSAVIEVVGSQSKAVGEDIAASVEGVVEGISHAQATAIARTEAEIEHLQTQLDNQTQEMAETVSGALVEIESVGQETQESLRDRILSAIRGLQDREELSNLRQQYARLRAQIALLDAKLAARYGDRYAEVKRQMENAKEWYEQEKTKVEASGTDPVATRQVELERKAGEIGVAIARKEQQIKESLKELWHSATQR